MADIKSSAWQQIRLPLNDWSKPALIALLKDLYEASSDNRDFLNARLQAEETSGPALENYRARINEQFFPKRGEPGLHLTEARKAIRDYRKATGNLSGTIDLMLTYVENGTKFTLKFGDIDEPFYDSLESILNKMTQLLLVEGRDLYPRFRERVRNLATHADDIGWGYGDYLQEQVCILEEKLANQRE